MIVVVETNFILELVIEQEEAEACQEIFDLCSRRKAKLVLPAFSIAEAGAVIERRTGSRRAFIKEDLDEQLRDAFRSDVLRRYAQSLSVVKEELRKAESDETHNWTRFRSKRYTHIELTGALLEEAAWLETMKGWRMPDAIVLASVRKYLERLRKRDTATPALFVSRDKDFLRAKNELQKLGCRIVVSYRDAVEIIRRQE
ncbi:MAG TPA: PIN domain-containing protein [Thermoanaerobaculia bacterium]|nr:PIN domain-containing protein [Thermoanaerobaculia bacterium]